MAIEIVQRDVEDSSSMLSADPLSFIFERFRFYGGVNRRLRDDVVAAVSDTAYATASLDLVDVLQRAMALQSISAQPDFDPLIIGFKRAHRLSEKEQWDRKPVEPSLFQHQAETNLQEKLRAGHERFSILIKQHEYAKALEVLVQLKEPIDEFFNGVMVNADDPAIRANRLSLLKDVDELFMSFADFSQIVVQGS